MDLLHVLNTLNFAIEPKLDCQLEHDTRARTSRARREIDIDQMQYSARLLEYVLQK
jgi:hypothetical protein